jgi:hypothetical protein
MRLPFFLFSACLLVACGGSDAAAPSSSASPTPTGDPTASPPAATDPDAGSSPTTPTADGGADAAAKDTRIDPIEVGHAWTYNVKVLGFYPTCSNGVHTATALQSKTKDGKSAVEVQSLCENAGTFDYAVDGDRVHSYFAGQWRLSLDAPVVAGHTWSDGFRDYRWDDKGTVTTPAGTFSDCWQATTVASYESYILLCRGVGPVKWHFEDGLGNGYEAVLTAKNF